MTGGARSTTRRRPPSTGGRHLLLCDLHDLPWDREAYLRRIREYAEARPAEAWIVGGGWGMPAFPRGTPWRGDLDSVVPDRDLFDRGAGEIGDARAVPTLVEDDAVHVDPALAW